MLIFVSRGTLKKTKNIMFRKIVSQLSFSPALVGQLNFYAKRLRKEQVTRRVGLVFVALALVVQSLVVFQAPDPANASNPNDMVPGGLGLGSSRSINNFLGPYDRNERRLKDVMNYFGITRQEIASAQFGSFITGQKISWGYEPRPGSTTIQIPDGNGTPVVELFGKPMYLLNGTNETIYAYMGYSQRIGWFAIMQACGNLVTDKYFPSAPPAPADIRTSKTAVNVTKGNIDATKTAAQVNDRIRFTIRAENKGGTAGTVNLSDNLKDVLPFSTLVDNGGGTFNPANSTLSWRTGSLAPGAKIEKSFVVQMKSSLETTQKDCKMKNSFYRNNLSLPVECTLPPPDVKLSKTATNVSQGNVDATKTMARENDRITYVLTAENKGGSPKEVKLEDNLGDTLEYAKLIDNGGGKYDEASRTISWPSVNLKAGAKEVRTFTVQVLPEIPATPMGVSDPHSYNCKMENIFGNDIIIEVPCPPQKVIEQVVPELPQTGPRENMLFAGIVLAIVAFFYFRSRQLGTEVRLIRRDINGGTI